MTGAAIMNNAMTTTAFELEGYRITRNLGVVRGIIASAVAGSAVE